MQNSENLPIIAIVVLFLVLYFVIYRRENFSTSGLAISDPYCTQLADVYYNPNVTDPKCRENYLRRICGKRRRNTIDFRTGNYFTENGQLL